MELEKRSKRSRLDLFHGINATGSRGIARTGERLFGDWKGIFREKDENRRHWLRRFGAPKCHTWFGHKKLAGGGGLYDIGVHALDLCMHLMDNFNPESVSGQIFTKDIQGQNLQGRLGLVRPRSETQLRR